MALQWKIYFRSTIKTKKPFFVLYFAHLFVTLSAIIEQRECAGVQIATPHSDLGQRNQTNRNKSNILSPLERDGYKAGINNNSVRF